MSANTSLTCRPARRGAILITAALLALGVAPAGSRADVILPAVIGDHMVLQQQADVAIWGWAAPGEQVSVSADWDSAVASTSADDRGRWLVRLPTPAAGGPYTLTIAGRNTVRVRDVLVGEVWICSGQSNMEMPLANVRPGYTGVDDGESEIDGASFPRIRLFTVPNEHSVPRRSDCRGTWTPCTPETARIFSATGYFFGRHLHEALDVPIGLVSADWGGTVAEAWMSREGLEPFPQFAAVLERLDALQDPTRRQAFTREAGERWWDDLDRGDAALAGWTGDGFADSGWPEMTLPATLRGDGLESFDGLVRFRRTFDLPAAWDGRAAVLELGPIDDYDDAWVNGVHVGSVHEPNRWAQPRIYEVPAGVLRAGTNVVAVRVLDTGGLGGINGRGDQVHLRRADDENDRIALAGPWHYARGRAASQLPPRPQGAGVSHNAPSVLFNGMIAPLIPYTVRGAIWYQGESNRTRADEYRSLFPALIRNWREQWGQDGFSFYFVQIAPFNYRGDTGQAASLRDAQRLALATPDTGMAVTLDIGDARDIHPTNKQDVGRRLALWALARDYGRGDVVCSGPLYRSMSVRGSAVRLAFDHVGGGLELRPSRRSPFLVAGADRRFFTADARLDGKAIIVSSPHVPEPVAVRYAWEAVPAATLFNREGLPASSFRTDDWSGPLPVPENEREVQSYRDGGDGFVDLFNGRDLDGWHNVNGAPSTWRVEDGMIACSGIPTGVLRTDRQYENFLLELEYRHLRPLGNAGVFVWSDPLPVRGQPFTRSVEVQVMDGQEGDWFTSDGDIFPIHGAAMTPAHGRGGSRAFPMQRRANPSPYWNHYRITCVDGSISLAVNGEAVTHGRDCLPRRGYLCLESEGSPVHFRNVRLRELPPSRPPPSPGDVAAVAEGFSPLYNGVNFDGWKTSPEHEGHWTASDWCLDFDGQGPDLWTERAYRDFVLVCDWRWTAEPTPRDRPLILPSGEYQAGADGRPATASVPDAGDSGIYLRGNSRSQVNIWCWPVGSGEVYGYRTDTTQPPDVRAAVTPSVNADAPIGQWNRFVITMRGEHLTVVLNDQTVIDRARLPGVPPSGPIALQRHGSPIQFANLYIRELD